MQAFPRLDTIGLIQDSHWPSSGDHAFKQLYIASTD